MCALKLISTQNNPPPIVLYNSNKMKNNKYHTVGTIPKWNIEIVERGKFDTYNLEIHDHSIGLIQAHQ